MSVLLSHNIECSLSFLSQVSLSTELFSRVADQCPSSIFQQLDATTTIECCSLCRRNNKCGSFTYEKETGSCLLGEAFSDGVMCNHTAQVTYRKCIMLCLLPTNTTAAASTSTATTTEIKTSPNRRFATGYC